MFLHLSVSHSVHRGVCLSACWDSRPPPLGADTSLEPDTPPGADTPPEQTPPGTRHFPGADTPPCTVHAGRASGTHPTGMNTCC